MNTSSSENLPVIFKEIEQLKSSFTFKDMEEEKAFYRKNSYLFATTSASLFRLLPSVPYSKHKSIFEKLLYNIQLLNIEEKYAEDFYENLEVNDIENSLDKVESGKPFLFCCFHTGAYSSIPSLFVSRGLDFGFLSNNTLTERKGKHFFKVQEEYCKKHGIHSTMQLINVEESRGVWQAIRMLKQGKSLVIYVDGNTGADNSKKQSENSISIDFLGEKLLVRKGIAFLSYTCDVPIIPVISRRENNMSEKNAILKRSYTLLPAIYPNNFEGKESENKVSKEEFAAKTMQKLYSILEKEITKNTENTNLISDWEGWIFVNKSFEQLQKTIIRTKPNQNILSTEKSSYIFNEERFALIENDDPNKNMLFDKFTYRFFPASELLCEIITYFSESKNVYLFEGANKSANMNPNRLKLSNTFVPTDALEKLVRKEILVQYN